MLVGDEHEIGPGKLRVVRELAHWVDVDHGIPVGEHERRVCDERDLQGERGGSEGILDEHSDRLLSSIIRRAILHGKACRA